MEYFGLTDIGLFREKNQDSFVTLTNLDGDFLALVCDGIGGGRAGEVASGLAVEYFKEHFVKTNRFESQEAEIKWFKEHIQKANDYVLDKSISNFKYFGMGTTLTGVFISENGVLSLNIGDSRTYGFDDCLVQLTEDDTLVNKMVKDGEITFEESLTHPKRHYLLKAVGVSEDGEAQVKPVEAFEQYLVCSDGLHGFVKEEEINEVLNNNDLNCRQKCEALLSLALLKGGYDNITVVLVSCKSL